MLHNGDDCIVLSRLDDGFFFSICLVGSFCVRVCFVFQGQLRAAFHALSDLYSTAQTKRLLAQVILSLFSLSLFLALDADTLVWRGAL